MTTDQIFLDCGRQGKARLNRRGLSWRIRGLVMAQCYLPSECAFICHWCCKRLSEHDVVIDHFLPLAKGGTDDVANLVVSCARCNLWKSDLHPDEAEIRTNEKLDREWSA